jgi:hypothetical protein
MTVTRSLIGTTSTITHHPFTINHQPSPIHHQPSIEEICLCFNEWTDGFLKNTFRKKGNLSHRSVLHRKTDVKLGDEQIPFFLTNSPSFVETLRMISTDTEAQDETNVSSTRHKPEDRIERVELLINRHLRHFLFFITILHFGFSYGVGVWHIFGYYDSIANTLLKFNVRGNRLSLYSHINIYLLFLDDAYTLLPLYHVYRYSFPHQHGFLSSLGE